MPSYSLSCSVLSFVRKFKDIERRLQFSSGVSMAERLVDHTLDLKETSELLEYLRENIFDYQVCP